MRSGSADATHADSGGAVTALSGLWWTATTGVVYRAYLLA